MSDCGGVVCGDPSMGAPAIYHIANRRRSSGSSHRASLSNQVNGLDKRILNGSYEKYLKVKYVSIAR